jgi:hypothetical protein
MMMLLCPSARLLQRASFFANRQHADHRRHAEDDADMVSNERSLCVFKPSADAETFA